MQITRRSTATAADLAHCAARTAGTEFVKITAEAKLLRLNLSSKDYKAKTPGGYVRERIVMMDF